MFEKNQQIIEQNRALYACSFHNWYEKFQKITIFSVPIKIPDNVVTYLLTDLIILPRECTNPLLDSETIDFGDNNDENYDNEDDEDDDEIQHTAPEFPEFSQRITDVIGQLGGAVYVKTNWHSPKDAFWITAGQTLRAQDITDVYQLLKASGLCKEDLVNRNVSPMLENNVDDNVDVDFVMDKYLILKKWLDIHPGTEFRCFVRNQHLIAISPRDWPQFHEHILTQKRDIVNDIRTMFREQIKHKFPLCDYIFDVIRSGKDHVLLVDFSPFGEIWTESLAFEWNELFNFPVDDMDPNNPDDDADGDDDPEFRYLTVDCGIQPRKQNNYGIPMDIIDWFKSSNNPSISSQSSNQNTNAYDSSHSSNNLNNSFHQHLQQEYFNQNNDVDDK